MLWEIGSIPGYCRQEVFNTSLQTLIVCLASWYHFSNSTNSGTKISFQHFPADINSVTSLLVPFLKQYQFWNKNQFKLDYKRGVFRDIAFRRFKEVLKTEGEARGFQHFPADIKSVTSLLVPFLKQYQFSKKNQFKLK